LMKMNLSILKTPYHALRSHVPSILETLAISFAFVFSIKRPPCLT
jgi:hypothetical protein